jgi:hypothetical protein
MATLVGASKAKPAAIQGWTFRPAAVVENAALLEEAVRSVVAGLLHG